MGSIHWVINHCYCPDRKSARHDLSEGDFNNLLNFNKRINEEISSSGITDGNVTNCIPKERQKNRNRNMFTYTLKNAQEG